MSLYQVVVRMVRFCSVDNIYWSGLDLAYTHQPVMVARLRSRNKAVTRSTREL